MRELDSKAVGVYGVQLRRVVCRFCARVRRCRRVTQSVAGMHALCTQVCTRPRACPRAGLLHVVGGRVERRFEASTCAGARRRSPRSRLWSCGAWRRRARVAPAVGGERCRLPRRARAQQRLGERRRRSAGRIRRQRPSQSEHIVSCPKRAFFTDSGPSMAEADGPV